MVLGLCVSGLIGVLEFPERAKLLEFCQESSKKVWAKISWECKVSAKTYVVLNLLLRSSID